MVLKCCPQYARKFGKLSSGHRTGKLVFIQSQRKAMPRMVKLQQIALISHTRKVMLKILQARLQQYVNRECLDVKAGFRKGRRTRDPTADICWVIEKAREFQKKTSISASLTTLKSLTLWIITNCRKFLKRWEYQTTLPAF